MRSIACAIISFVCWYAGYNGNPDKRNDNLRLVFTIVGIGMLGTSIILMAAGL